MLGNLNPHANLHVDPPKKFPLEQSLLSPKTVLRGTNSIPSVTDLDQNALATIASVTDLDQNALATIASVTDLDQNPLATCPLTTLPTENSSVLMEKVSKMLQSWKNWCWKLELATSLAISGATIALSGNYALAQSNIVPDRTLGAENSTVTSDEIRGGAIRGTNLFHSFLEFKVGEGKAAYFVSPNSKIQNILARVTGGNPSKILGKLGTRGGSSPNLFLINPNGILFGPNASLDVSGSFVASTASSLKFTDGTQFSATEPQTTPLLTVSVPIGLQFGSTGASITNQSIAPVLDEQGNRIPVGLQVPAGKTLALVGGDVALEGSNLTALSGRIELGSVAGPSLVGLTSTAQGWALGYEDVQNFKDIRLSQGAIVYAAALSEGGDIQVQGRRVTLSNGSSIQAFNFGSRSGGTLAVNASESVELTGSKTTANGLFNNSSLRTDTNGSGAAGNLTIDTGKLIVQDGAQVSAGTGDDSTGQGGNLVVNASDVELSGTSADGQNASSLTARSRGAGPAGNLTVTTGQLGVRDGAQVTVSALESGDAGNLEVTARSIQLENKGAIIAETASGEGGNIRLRIQDLLLLRNNSRISTTAGTARAGGNGGNITIDTDLLVALENSDITANAFEGRGGEVRINAQGVFRSPDSDITATSDLGPQFSGTVELNTPDVDPSQGVVAFPEEVVDVSGLIPQTCPPGSGPRQGKFVVTGRGGVPPNPGETLSTDAIQVGLVTLNPKLENRSSPDASTNPTSSSAAPIVEAQGWTRDAMGNVVLTANAPTVKPHSSWQRNTKCGS